MSRWRQAPAWFVCATLILAPTAAEALDAGQVPILFGRPGWALPGASADMDFAHSRYWGKTPGQLTVSRASTESEVCNGVLYSFAANQPAITPCGLWVWEARTNGIRNSAMIGASVGVFPTNWITANSASGTFACSVAAVNLNGTGEGGFSTVDISCSGTTTGGGFYNIQFGNILELAASYGLTYTLSSYARLLSGSVSPMNSAILVNANTSGGAYLSTSTGVFTMGSGPLGSQRYSTTYTPANSTTGFLLPYFSFGYSGAVSATFTFRTALPQLELNPNLPASVASAVKAADGTGGVISASGVYTVTGGTCPTPPTLNVTWDAGGLMTVNSAANAGSCTVLPPSPATLAYASGAATGWTGATVTLTPTDNSAKGFATGPILTSAGAATRAQGVVSASLASSGAYSLAAWGTPAAPASSTTNQFLAALSDGTTLNRLSLFRQSATGAFAANFYVSGVQQWPPVNGVWAQSALGKLSASAASGAQIGAYNQTAFIPAVFPTVPALTQLRIGDRGDGGLPFNGSIARVAGWPRSALSQSQLNAVTK